MHLSYKMIPCVSRYIFHYVYTTSPLDLWLLHLLTSGYFTSQTTMLFITCIVLHVIENICFICLILLLSYRCSILTKALPFFWVSVSGWGFHFEIRVGRDAERGAGTPPTFYLGEQGEQKCPLWNVIESFLDSDMIQLRSNKWYKQVKCDWKREQFVHLCER